MTPHLAAQRAFTLAMASKPYWDEHDAAHYADVSWRTIYRWLNGQTSVDLYAILLMPVEFQRVFWSALHEQVPTVRALRLVPRKEETVLVGDERRAA